MTARTALILGIDQYPHSPLQACGIDARRMQERLGRNYDGSANYRCAVVTDADQRLHRSTMMELMEKVFLSAADEIVLYFAGHGGVDRFGGFILAQDSHDGGTGIRMSEIVTMANRSDASQVVILMDCCSASAMAERDALAEGVSRAKKRSRRRPATEACSPPRCARPSMVGLRMCGAS